MKKNGFTLVELLAVIIVIGLISTFALPQVLNQFNNNIDNLSKQQEELLEESAYSYVLENEKEYRDTDKKCVSIKKLVEEEALERAFAIQIYGEDFANKGYGIRVTYTNDTLRTEYVKDEGFCNN